MKPHTVYTVDSSYEHALVPLNINANNEYSDLIPVNTVLFVFSYRFHLLNTKSSIIEPSKAAANVPFAPFALVSHFIRVINRQRNNRYL